MGQKSLSSNFKRPISATGIAAHMRKQLASRPACRKLPLDSNPWIWRSLYANEAPSTVKSFPFFKCTPFALLRVPVYSLVSSLFFLWKFHRLKLSLLSGKRLPIFKINDWKIIPESVSLLLGSCLHLSSCSLQKRCCPFALYWCCVLCVKACLQSAAPLPV